MTQRDAVKAIMALHVAMDLMDDGYHQKEIQTCIIASNSLFTQLSEKNQQKIIEHYNKKKAEALA